jgi:hypothetical protein
MRIGSSIVLLRQAGGVVLDPEGIIAAAMKFQRFLKRPDRRARRGRGRSPGA